MGDHHHVLREGERPFPLLPLIGAGGLVIFSLLSVAWMQWFAEPSASTVAAAAVPVLDERQLDFEDTELGQVLVRDASSGELIATIEPGQSGFVRSTLRGLVRARRQHGGTLDTRPFILQQRANGQLLLVDPVTDQVVDLWAFGQSNARIFAGYLPTNSNNTLATGEGDEALVQQASKEQSP